MAKSKWELVYNCAVENFENKEFSLEELEKVYGDKIRQNTLTAITGRNGFIKKDNNKYKINTLSKQTIEKITGITPQSNIVSNLSEAINRINSLRNRIENSINGDDYLGDSNSLVGIYRIVYVKDPSWLYIGKTTQPFESRWNQHRADLKKGTHCDEKLLKCFQENNNDLSLFKFEIQQAVIKNEEAIDLRERYWIEKYDNDPKYHLFNTLKPHLH